MPVIEAKVIGTLVTMGLQVGSSILNQKYGKKNTETIKKLQQEAKIEAQKHEMDRDWDKFRRSCEFQTEVEAKSHKERLEDIEKEFSKIFEGMAYANAVASSPLNVTPYLIKKGTITFDGSQYSTRSELFCILSSSNNPIFNRDILPALDNVINNYLSTFWNSNSTHKVCYYEGIWDRNKVFKHDYIQNLRTLIPAPTLMVTPYLRDGNCSSISFKINIWGLGQENARGNGNSIKDENTFEFEPNDVPSLTISGNRKITKEEVRAILEKIVPGLVCMIGYVADNYYWANYYEQPLLPNLLAKKEFLNDSKLLSEYRKVYEDMLNLYVLGDCSNLLISRRATEMAEIAMINNFNFPERGLQLLASIMPIMSNNSYDKMNTIVNSLLSDRAGRVWANTHEALSSIHFYSSDLTFLKTLSEVAPEYKNVCERIIHNINISSSLSSNELLDSKYGRTILNIDSNNENKNSSNQYFKDDPSPKYIM